MYGLERHIFKCIGADIDDVSLAIGQLVQGIFPEVTPL